MFLLLVSVYLFDEFVLKFGVRMCVMLFDDCDGLLWFYDVVVF